MATTNTCDIRTLTKPAAPNGVTYYWEVNPGDTDFTSANATSATLQAGQTGNYYLRAKDNNGPCWSSATTISMNVNPVDITVSAFDPVNYVVQATHSIRLLPGFYANSGNSFSAKISITPECNNLTNWNEQIVYNEQGAIISDTRTYTNGFGTPVQTQNKDLISGLVWGSQSLFNSYAKPAGSTLPAPLLENDFVYKTSLALNASGTPYSPADFDLRTTSGASGEVSNPKPFGTQPGSVGWYYSSNNDKESLTPITQYPYSRSYVVEGPEPTSTVSANPGDMHRMGSGHTQQSDRYLITTNELSHYYSLRSYFTNSISTGGLGYKYVSTDANGKQSVTFVDADGRTVASAMVLSVSGTPPNLTFTYDYWSYTYYNDAGQITATIAPKDVNTGSSAQPPATLFGYDHMGRMIETTSPDEGTSRFVYSTDGKIRFSENQEQRNATPKRFSYTNYDYLGRLVESGEYTCVTGGGYVFEPETTATPATNSILNIIDNNLTVPVESVNAGNYTGVSYKLDATRCAQYNFITYDIPGSGTPKVQNYLYGQISKTESPSAITWYSYDEAGRLAWTRQNIYGLGIKSINYTYDFFGNVTRVAYQIGQPDAFYHHYTYDIQNRLTAVNTSKDSVNMTLQAKYYYYLHGPLKRVELAGNLQGLDYVYTINGSLKSINHVDVSKDPGADGSTGAHANVTPDVFGMTLNYYDNDYAGANYSTGSFTTSGLANNYNGLIKSIGWTTPVDNPASKKVYGFTYDNLYQLQNSQWGTLSASAGNYTATFSPVEAYREGGLTYDKNGNIQTLTRKGKTGNSLANYGYVYETNTNRLDKVNNDGALLTDYAYNTIGQMVQQVDGGRTMNVSYTAYGLVKDVRDASNNLMLSYTYDDRGNRIIKTTYQGGSATRSTYYVHDAGGNVLATYDQTLPGGTPQLIEVPIYGSGRIALYKPAVNTYFYELNDHLGNVKAVIGQPQTVVYTATMETETAATEDTQFKNIAPRTVYAAANNTPGGNEAVRINNGQPNGGFSGRIGGPGISLKVMPGDVISAEVYGYYEGGSGYSSTLPASTLIAAASGIFGGVNGAPGDPGKIFSAFNQAYGGGFAGGAGSTNDLVPAAYLNMIMFDANMGVDPTNLPMAAVSISSAANGSRQKISIGPITIPAPGYVYIYVDDNSNSPNWVYFDDLKVTHVQSPFVAGGDFYPFGLTMDDRQMTREPYRYGYQGQYAEKDPTTGWNEFELRDWDPTRGRWLTPDPFKQHWSPYLGMSNNPARNIDQDGGFDDVYAWTDKNKVTSIVRTKKNYDNLYIDGEYFGKRNKGWGLSVFSDARVFSGYNFGFYSYTYGESLGNGNVLKKLFDGAPSTSAQTELMQASIANRDPRILYGTLAIPAAAITAGEVIAIGPAITNTYSSVALEIKDVSTYVSTRLYTSSEALSTQVYRTVLRAGFRPLVRIATPGSLTMRAAVEINWLSKKSVNIQPLLRYSAKNYMGWIDKLIKKLH